MPKEMDRSRNELRWFHDALAPQPCCGCVIENHDEKNCKPEDGLRAKGNELQRQNHFAFSWQFEMREIEDCFIDS